MTVQLNPYIGFRDNAQAALEFYQSVFGGELELSTFASMGAGNPADADKIMHGSLRSDLGVLMASDAPEGMPAPDESNISISLSGDDESTLRGFWDGLAADGQVSMPLEVAPWGDAFGMLTDKFGVDWMVNITGVQRA